MTDKEIMEMMCKVEGYCCAEKKIENLKLQLSKMKIEQEQTRKEIEEFAQEYFRINRDD